MKIDLPVVLTGLAGAGSIEVAKAFCPTPVKNMARPTFRQGLKTGRNKPIVSPETFTLRTSPDDLKIKIENEKINNDINANLEKLAKKLDIKQEDFLLKNTTNTEAPPHASSLLKETTHQGNEQKTSLQQEFDKMNAHRAEVEKDILPVVFAGAFTILALAVRFPVATFAAFSLNLIRNKSLDTGKWGDIKWD